VTLAANSNPVSHLRIKTGRVGRIGVCIRAYNYTIPEMADHAGYAFLLKLLVKVRVFLKNRLETFLVPESENKVFLLILQGNMAVEADLLVTVKDQVYLVIWICPGLGVHTG